KLGAAVDLKERAARLVVTAAESPQARITELHAQLIACQQHFNRAEENAFAECLDPQIVIYTISGDYYGREAAMQYYRSHYFQQHPPAQLFVTPRAHHALGEAIWVEYDLRIEAGQRLILARGTALCQKENGKWRIVHMNHSRPLEQEATSSSNASASDK
ncbi:MAG TPA: nuclear transport factor 2 family protein, partial [Candidatus Angelobacter sp.]